MSGISGSDYKARQLAILKEREKGPKGGSKRPVHGVNTEGRRSTMGQGRSERRRQDINNSTSTFVLTAKAREREHHLKNREAEVKKLAKRAARLLDQEFELACQSIESEEMALMSGEDDARSQGVHAEESGDQEEVNSTTEERIKTPKQLMKERRKEVLDRSFKFMSIRDATPNGKILETVYRTVGL